MFPTSLHSEVARTPARLRASNHTSLQQSLQTLANSSASQTSVSYTPSSQNACFEASTASSTIRMVALDISRSALSSRTYCFAMPSSISVWQSLLHWSLAWSWAFFQPGPGHSLSLPRHSYAPSPRQSAQWYALYSSAQMHPQGLVGLGTEVSLNLGIIPGVLDPLLSYKNLLDSLHKNNKGIPYKIYIYIYV